MAYMVCFFFVKTVSFQRFNVQKMNPDKSLCVPSFVWLCFRAHGARGQRPQDAEITWRNHTSDKPSTQHSDLVKGEIEISNMNICIYVYIQSIGYAEMCMHLRIYIYIFVSTYLYCIYSHQQISELGTLDPQGNRQHHVLRGALQPTACRAACARGPTPPRR